MEKVINESGNEVAYEKRNVSSISEGFVNEHGTWQVTTKMIEERLPDGCDEWEDVVFEVMVYGDSFEQAHQQSAAFLLNKVMSLGAGTSSSLFDLESEDLGATQ